MIKRQSFLPLIAPGDTERDSLVARWNILMRKTLPEMAQASRWPIVLDHCFMRVCLDAAVGGPWHTRVKRPAIRNLSDIHLAEAVRVAESIVAMPDTLAALNAQSLQWRKSKALTKRDIA
jgi:hypothetical protein